MDKMQSLQAQKDDLKVRHAQEIKAINKKSVLKKIGKKKQTLKVENKEILLIQSSKLKRKKWRLKM